MWKFLCILNQVACLHLHSYCCLLKIQDALSLDTENLAPPPPGTHSQCCTEAGTHSVRCSSSFSHFLLCPISSSWTSLGLRNPTYKLETASTSQCCFCGINNPTMWNIMSTVCKLCVAAQMWGTVRHWLLRAVAPKWEPQLQGSPAIKWGMEREC